MQSPELRSATRADVLAMSTMQRASLVETYEAFLGRIAVEEFIDAGNIERYFEERWQQATLATLGGEIVGVAALEGALLDLIWVKPTKRSKGTGSRLMERVEEQAALECNEVTLEVRTVNRRAVAFYERRGFSVVGTLDDLATGLEKLVMRKAL